MPGREQSPPREKGSLAKSDALLLTPSTLPFDRSGLRGAPNRADATAHIYPRGVDRKRPFTSRLTAARVLAWPLGERVFEPPGSTASRRGREVKWIRPGLSKDASRVA